MEHFDGHLPFPPLHGFPERRPLTSTLRRMLPPRSRDFDGGFDLSLLDYSEVPGHRVDITERRTTNPFQEEIVELDNQPRLWSRGKQNCNSAFRNRYCRHNRPGHIIRFHDEESDDDEHSNGRNNDDDDDRWHFDYIHDDEVELFYNNFNDDYDPQNDFEGGFENEDDVNDLDSDDSSDNDQPDNDTGSAVSDNDNDNDVAGFAVNDPVVAAVANAIDADFANEVNNLNYDDKDYDGEHDETYHNNTYECYQEYEDYEDSDRREGSEDPEPREDQDDHGDHDDHDDYTENNDNLGSPDDWNESGSNPSDNDNENNPNLQRQNVLSLTTEAGSRVYVVGTVHYSTESQNEVLSLIRCVRPNYIVLELCKTRSVMLEWDEETVFQQAQNLSFTDTLRKAFQLGFFEGLFFITLYSISVRLTKELGVAPGGEFRIAYREAKQIPDCEIIFGDLPIGFTLKRLLSSLSLWQVVKIITVFLCTDKKMSQEEVEKYKKMDEVEKMLLQFSEDSPEIAKVLIEERDAVLTYFIQRAAECAGPNVVVAVVGLGHLMGIRKNWGKVTEEKIREIMTIPPPRLYQRVIKYSIKFTTVGLFMYGFHKIASSSSFYRSIFRSFFPTLS